MQYEEPLLTADKILSIYQRQNVFHADAAEIQRLLGYDRNSPESVNIQPAINKLLKDDYITPISMSSNYFNISGDGILFIKAGGYKTHVESINKKEAEEREIKELNTEKTKIDLANAKRIYKTYFSTRTMAITACIVSVLLLLLKLAEVFGWLKSQKG